MASSSSQNLQAAKPSTWPVGIASDTIQSVAKVDLPPHTEFAKLTHGDRTFYLGLKLVKLSCHEMIPNANVDPLYGSVFIKEIGNPSEANLVHDDDRTVIYTGAGGIKKGDVLAWCCQSSEKKHASIGWTEMRIDKEKGTMTDFRAMQIASRSQEKEKFVNAGKESATKSLGCEKGKMAEDEEPEHDENSGGVSIGDVKALYKELEECKLKGRL